MTHRGAQRAGKLFVLNYKEFMPPTLVTRDASELAASGMEHEDTPRRFGGNAVLPFQHPRTDQNFSSLLSSSAPIRTSPMAQKYLPDVRKGDAAHHPGGRKICRRHQPGARRP
jgi:glutathione synthase